MNPAFAIVAGFAAFQLGSGAIAKIIDRESFVDVLLQTPGLRASSRYIASVLPLIELLLAAGLMVGANVEMFAALAALLYVGFVGVSLTTTAGQPCGCGPFVPRRSRIRAAMGIGIAVVLALGVVGAADDPAPIRLAAGSSAVLAAMILMLSSYLRSRLGRTRKERRGSRGVRIEEISASSGAYQEGLVR